jgi:glycosyltransferase involved in cell wall biosynthesis
MFPYGAGDIFFAAEVRALIRSGVEVTVVPARPIGRPSAPDLVHASLTHRLVDWTICRGAARIVRRRPVASLRAITLLLSDLRPKVLIRNVAIALKGLWLGSIACDRDVSHIHAHWAGPPSSLAMVAACASGVPWSFTAHSFDISANNLLQCKSERARFVRFISRHGMQIAADLVPSADRTRWCVIHLGVDCPPEPVPRARPTPAVLVPARFSAEKRHVMLLEIVARLRASGVSFRVELAGSGPLENEVRAAVAALGLYDDVSFLGWLTHDELLARYRDGDVDVVALT